MGTETVPLRIFQRSNSIRVKLNNPLMGTETTFFFTTWNEYIYMLVKLNNPLMGTETIRSTLNLNA